VASKRRIRRRSCGNKRRHVDETAARKEIHRLATSVGPIGFMVPYRCGFCSGWHIGHADKRRAR